MAFSFSFNFGAPAGGAATTAAAPAAPTAAIEPPQPAAAAPCVFSPISVADVDIAGCTTSAVPGTPLQRVLVTDVDAVTGVHRDVVSGAYEGGAKLWECTSDMLLHLLGDAGQSKALAGACVVDLGCGAGLLGVEALRCGASTVVFQDLNDSVLRAITCKNVLLNNGAAGLGAALFVGTSWEAWAAAMAAAAAPRDGLAADAPAAPLPPASFPSPAALRGCVDVILASEVTYNVDYYRSLCDVMVALLRPGTGKALVATKRYYYGVGGGVTLFTAFLERHYPALACRRVAAIEDGKSVAREILEVSWAVASAAGASGGGGGATAGADDAAGALQSAGAATA